ncbi:MAG: hypothetical protein AAFO74_03425 [Pseudomonadota bacterium]
MIKLHDIPDWATGVLAASAAFYGFCYLALAPRVIADETNDALPLCIQSLEIEQERFLSDIERGKTKERDAEVESIQRKINAKRAWVNEVRRKSQAYRDLRRALPLGLGPDVSAALPTQKDLADAEAEIAKLKTRLANLPQISLPRAPESELLTTCTCAVMASMGGQRADYSLHLASFRLVKPEALSNTQKVVGDALRWDQCGTPSWEAFS